MQRKTILMTALLSAFLLVSSVSAVPNVKIDNGLTGLSNIFENFNFGVFNRIKDKVIDEVRMEVYNDTYARVQFIFYNHMELSEGQGFYLTEDGTDYEFHEEVLRSNFYERLVDVAVVIILFMVVMFGHVGPGYGLGALCALMVLFIPCLMFAMIEGTISTVAIVTGMLLGGDLNQFIYDYGVVGLLVFVFLLLPLIVLISIVVYPVMTVLLTVDLLACVITEALEIVDDITP